MSEFVSPFLSVQLRLISENKKKTKKLNRPLTTQMTGRKRSGGIHAATRAPAVCSFFFCLWLFGTQHRELSSTHCFWHIFFLHGLFYLSLSSNWWWSVMWAGLFTVQIYGPVIPQSDMVTTVNLVIIWIKTTTPGWFFPGPGFSLWRDLGAARSSTKRLNIKGLDISCSSELSLNHSGRLILLLLLK